MARVKRGVASKKRHKKVLKQAKGYYGNKSRSFRAANEQVIASLTAAPAAFFSSIESRLPNCFFSAASSPFLPAYLAVSATMSSREAAALMSASAASFAAMMSVITRVLSGHPDEPRYSPDEWQNVGRSN